MLESVAEVTAEVEDRIGSARLISLFLDLDGTLVPISPLPESPQLDSETAGTLNLLAGLDHVITTIISGRAIDDLFSRIRLDHIVALGKNQRLALHFVPQAMHFRGGLVEGEGRGNQRHTPKQREHQPAAQVHSLASRTPAPGPWSTVDARWGVRVTR